MADFIERRKEYRLPFGGKVIITDGTRSVTAHAANISRGGIFVKSLDPFPIETEIFATFILPHQASSLIVRSKVAHLIFDKQRCEVECGMGFQFLELTKSQKSILNLHILNEQTAYLELREILQVERPDAYASARYMKRLPELTETDLLGLRYRVNRICTLFQKNQVDPDEKTSPGILIAS